MRKIRTILLIAAIMTITVGAAQIPVPRKSCMRMSGTIGKNPIEMTLVKINDSIYGEFTCLPGYEELFPAGVVLEVSGTSDEKGNLTLLEPYSDTRYVFKGGFRTSQSITGTFESGKKKLPFEVKEHYPEGSVPLNVYYLQGKHPLVKKPNSPEAEIALCMILPGESSNPAFSDSLRLVMLNEFTGKKMKSSSPDLVLGSIKQTYFDNYVSANEEIYKPGMGQSFSWISLKYMHVLLNSRNLLSFYVENYAFTGGAHGLQVREHTVVNLKTGKVIGLKDIFRTGFREKLTAMLTEKARLQMQLEDGKSLKEAGFFVDEVEPSDNFYITPGGIGFFYNHYEIAPYSYGPEDYFISFGELNQVIDRNGALRDFLK